MKGGREGRRNVPKVRKRCILPSTCLSPNLSHNILSAGFPLVLCFSYFSFFCSCRLKYSYFWYTFVPSWCMCVFFLLKRGTFTSLSDPNFLCRAISYSSQYSSLSLRSREAHTTQVISSIMARAAHSLCYLDMTLEFFSNNIRNSHGNLRNVGTLNIRSFLNKYPTAFASFYY